MHSRTAIAALALLPALASAQDALTDFDSARVQVSYASGMGFHNGPGELHSTVLDARAFLGQPLQLGGDWKLASLLRYRATFLDTEGTAVGFPMKDETLQNLSIQEFLFHSSTNSPWIYGVWAQASLASDLQHIDGDDFLFDVAAAVGYRFSDRFTLFGGVAALDLNGDSWVLPGIGFDWRPSDCVRVGLYGPNFVASYRPDENWIFSLKAEPGGSTWNIDGRAGRSERLEFRSNQVGLHAERRLTDAWWLDVGAGVTLNNKIELGSTSGLTNFKDNLDDGWFASVGLRMATW